MSTHQRDLRSIVADGVLFSVMVGLGESYVPAFALALGAGAVTAALLATGPMLVGAVLQLVTPAGIRWLGSYRRWVVTCASLQALSFVPLFCGAALGGLHVAWIAAACTAYWAFGMASSPAWNAWVTTLVAPKERAGFFARRTRAGQAGLVLALLSAGILLELGRDTERELYFFAAIFAVATLARLGSASFLARQSERPGLAAEHPRAPLRAVVAGVQRSGAAGLLAYLVALQAATNVAAPFFTPFMLGPLDFSYAQFMVLTAAAFVSRIAVLPGLGRVAAGRGFKRVLWLGAVGVVPLPALWLVSGNFYFLLGVQLLAGAAWAAVEYATTLAFFERIDEAVRAAVLTLFNVAHAAAIAFGALAGAWLFRGFEDPEVAFRVLFAVSTTVRLLGLTLLVGAPSVLRVRRAIDLRTLAVRPSAGAIQRPILAEFEEDAEPRAEA